jgi:hypothetical protein
MKFLEAFTIETHSFGKYANEWGTRLRCRTNLRDLRREGLIHDVVVAAFNAWVSFITRDQNAGAFGSVS